MVKQRKTNYIEIHPGPREAIAAVRGEEDFVELLRRELEWPIPMNVERLADVAIPHDLQSDFGFKPEEERIAVSRLLTLAEDQPWGVFLFEFKTKRPYLTHLRRLLRVLGSQRTLKKGDPIRDRNDLLFVCTPDWRQSQFVHFSGEKPESPVIRAFGRIQGRVEAGGIPVPEADVRRHSKRRLTRLFRIYRPLVKSLNFFDNSGVEPILLFREEEGKTNIHNWDLYQQTSA